jgi:hypothetical protein
MGLGVIGDIGLNFFDIKQRHNSNISDLLIANDLGKIHDQSAAAFNQLAPGKTLTLAFDYILPPNAEQLYQQIFADLIPKPNFSRVNGF